VTALLVSHQLHARFGMRITAEMLVLPADPTARLPDVECARAEIAFFSGDIFPDHSRQFFSAVRKAPQLKWLHAFNVGVDHPIYAELLERGVRVTTSAGSTAEPIAQTAIMGLLALARGFPRWLVNQRTRTWSPQRQQLPRDLKEQTAVVVGLGRIGAEIARLARRGSGGRAASSRRAPRPAPALRLALHRLPAHARDARDGERASARCAAKRCSHRKRFARRDRG
jgi:D-2-hydroxyacid dehydrogenase (NADP+)